jgi:phosphatidylglycerophosphatase C
VSVAPTAPVSSRGALAVFDLDGTITRHDTLLPFLLGFLWRHPLRVPRLLLALPAALRFLVDRDHGRVKGALLHVTLGGVERVTLEAWADEFVPRLCARGLFPQALAAIAEHRARGDRLVLMSASVDLYVPRIGSALGFDEVLCTAVLWQPTQRLDGRLAGGNCRGELKRTRLAALIERERPRCVYAYGNSRADLPHLALAHHAYLINAPNGLVRQQPQIEPLRWQA